MNEVTSHRFRNCSALTISANTLFLLKDELCLMNQWVSRQNRWILRRDMLAFRGTAAHPIVCGMRCVHAYWTRARRQKCYPIQETHIQKNATILLVELLSTEYR